MLNIEFANAINAFEPILDYWHNESEQKILVPFRNFQPTPRNVSRRCTNKPTFVMHNP